MGLGAQKPVRFAVIGCGRIAPKHTEAILAVEGAQLAAVMDIVPERAAQFSERYGVTALNDYESVLQRADIDVVNICTPSGLHAEMGVAAARAGKHVVVEKPMALSLRDADRLINECERAGVKLFVVHQNRYNEAVKQLRAAVDAGHFGKMTHGVAVVRWNRDQAYYDSADWRGTWSLDGGVLMNQSIHNVDLLQWMMGPVESVFAYTTTALRNIEAEDLGVAVIRFQSGALGVIEGTSTIYPRNLEETLSVFGEKGTCVLGGVAVNRVETWRFADEVAAQGPDDADQSVDPPSVYGFGHREYMRDVVSAIRENTPPFIGGPDGRKALEVVLGIYESARSGQPVTFPVKETWASLPELMQGEAPSRD